MFIILENGMVSFNHLKQDLIGPSSIHPLITFHHPQYCLVGLIKLSNCVGQPTVSRPYHKKLGSGQSVTLQRVFSVLFKPGYFSDAIKQGSSI